MANEDGTYEGVAPLDLDKYLNPLVKNNITEVGLELEGAWVTVPPGAATHRDGSVTVSGPGVNFVGEIVSEPMQPGGAPLWLKRHWPNFTDKSCGLHVHMSFKTLHQYHLLTVPEYQETILHYLGEWAKKEGLVKTHGIWTRLAGTNQFCRKLFWPDYQIQAKTKVYQRDQPGHRYTIINYPLKQHGTIEVRVLPMFETWEMGSRAVRAVLDITNACLCLLATRDKADIAAILIKDDDDYREYKRDVL